MVIWRVCFGAGPDRMLMSLLPQRFPANYLRSARPEKPERGTPDCAADGRFYDTHAAGYDRRHARWLKHAGGEAQAAIEGAVRALLRPDTHLLDVGCGTGLFASRLLAEGLRPGRITLLDTSRDMLASTHHLPVTRLRTPMHRIPRPDHSFDMVTCLWALETVRDRASALREIFRVLKPGGWACFAFCADARPGSLAGRILRHTIERRGSGEFLKTDEVIAELSAAGKVSIQRIPCRGPAAAILCRRVAIQGGPSTFA